jgi:quercetin dioxygenase-like cupin family protein
MNLTRYDSAPAYHPANHEGMHCLRLQGHEAGSSDTIWLGLSHLLPGGGTTLHGSTVEKLYVVLEGEVTISTDSGEHVLRKYDSVRLAPGERRALKNNTNQPASILLAMPYP